MLYVRCDHSSDSRHSRTYPDARGSSPSREQLGGEDVDEGEGDAGEELAHEEEEIRKPRWIAQKSRGQDGKPR